MMEDSRWPAGKLATQLRDVRLTGLSSSTTILRYLATKYHPDWYAQQLEVCGYVVKFFRAQFTTGADKDAH